MKLIKILSYGRISYSQGLKLQKIIIDKHLQNPNLNEDTLIFVEHDPVYTVGLRDKKFLEEEKKLKSLGAEFYKTNRGGLITFHGPGQLVVYPIINLKRFTPSVRWYVKNLENTVIDLCKRFDLKAQTTCDTGVWIQDRKICALGIHGTRFITSHGLALNCDVELEWFSHIIPCGLEGKEVTSISKELGRNISVEQVIPHIINSFSTVFKCNLCNYPKNQVDEIKKMMEI